MKDGERQVAGGGSTTIGVISNNRSMELERLAAHLLELYSHAGIEMVVAFEKEGVAEPREHRDEQGVRWIEIPPGQGLAYNRNRVVDAANGEILVFLDDDCMPEHLWLESLLEPLRDPAVDAVMGKVVVPDSCLLGDSIAALGYPAGGTTGYRKMFNVDEDGLTDNISTLNCAIRTSILKGLGGFDESMTHGGEDTELAWRMARQGLKILYSPAASVVHPPRSGFLDFCRWFFRRGRAKYQFATRVPSVGSFVGRRIKSYGSILAKHGRDKKIVLIVPLLISSIILQQAGFLYEFSSSRRKETGAMPRGQEGVT